MQKISFVRKLITCVLAGLIIGASAFRISITYFKSWGPIGNLAIIPVITVIIAIVYAVIWQTRKKDHQSILAFWQGLIRYGIAFDLAEFGWAKIFHLQLVMPTSKLDLPYNSFSPSDIFWNFFSYSYPLGCIIATLQIGGSLLLLFHRTRLVGVFMLLPVLTNILLMDIFYQIGFSVVVHTSIMMAGLIYLIAMEYNRLKEFFFSTVNRLPQLHLPNYVKLIIRLSIIYIPLLLIAMQTKVDRYPELTGKYAVKQLSINHQLIQQPTCADSTLTMVYFDIKNGCVFQFNTPANRWNGTYSKDSDHLLIKWRSPIGKPAFDGTLSKVNTPGNLMLTGMLGKDLMDIALQKITN